jgi:hypothetical protein
MPAAGAIIEVAKRKAGAKPGTKRGVVEVIGMKEGREGLQQAGSCGRKISD